MTDGPPFACAWLLAAALLACDDDASCWRLAPLEICDANNRYADRCDGCGKTFRCVCSNVDGSCHWAPRNTSCDCLTDNEFQIENCPSE